jgi:FAD/FMN-containing dehydrogenase
MKRRNMLRMVATLPLWSAGLTAMFGLPKSVKASAPQPRQRVRPGDLGWPSSASWDNLNRDVSGRLLKLESPFADCGAKSGGAACSEALEHIKNPYFIGDQPALTQASGWVDAWTSLPSVYAVAAGSTADVVAAVNFARQHNLRLVVKGGGHGYQGTSNSPDSLLVWTRAMNDVSLHDAFVAQGCKTAQPAVTIGAGAMWADAYEAVTTRGGRYVQGGGCRTVGVAGLVQGGGFGSWSKRYGTGAANLLEAEIVTADGKVRVANECLHPDLFWAIKGGGGGTFGVVTRLTLRTHELPEYFGAVNAMVKASTDDAYRTLIGRALSFYQSELSNPHWGEKMAFVPENHLEVSMLFQGLDPQQVQSIWAPFFDWVRASSEYSFIREVRVLSVPARRFWDADYLQQQVPGVVMKDSRPGARPYHAFWTENIEEAGQLLHAYKSVWLPASLLQATNLPGLVDAVFASSRHWGWAFHFNKGLAGAPAEQIAAAKHTAMNPNVLDAFALAIIASTGPAAYPDMPGPGPDLAQARSAVAHVTEAMDELLKVAPGAGAYVSESDYFQKDWQKAFWGTNYPQLAAIKRKYDPDGLFFVHHGVGSEVWSEDGFTRHT